MRPDWVARPPDNRKYGPSECERNGRIPVYAQWNRIIARAEEIRFDGHQLTLIVDTAVSSTHVGSRHNVSSAAITALVFTKQRSYRKSRIVVVALRSSRGMIIKLQINPPGVERKVEAWLESGRATKRSSTLIPAPVVAFLIDRT